MYEISKLALVAAGGALGAVSRFVVSHSLHQRLGDGFPWGTLTANLVGSFLMGLLVGVGLNSEHRSFLLLGIGFLGSFTTFSAFSVESLKHLSDGRWLISLVNISANVVCCLVAAALGIGIAKLAGWGASR